MRYLMPYLRLKEHLLNGGGHLSEPQVMAAVRAMLPGVAVDEAWYLKTYPDVAEAVAQGLIRSAQAHFISDGYFEGRQPFPHQIDEKWYLRTYPDVGEAIETGEIDSPLEHYVMHGFEEGRRPGALD